MEVPIFPHTREFEAPAEDSNLYSHRKNLTEERHRQNLFLYVQILAKHSFSLENGNINSFFSFFVLVKHALGVQQNTYNLHTSNTMNMHAIRQAITQEHTWFSLTIVPTFTEDDTPHILVLM